MNPAMKAAQEGVGANYDAAMLLEARERTWKVIDEIAGAMQPGMTEEQGVDVAHDLLAKAGLRRGWHALHLRFGPNTLKNYDEASAPGVVLKETDIFFIDIGPVWEKWEGDGGDTFVLGDDPVMHAAKRDVRLLFDRVQDHWRDGAVTGQALYAFAAREAEAMGWRLNLGMAGHRLADFPHAAIHRGTLAAAPYAPSASLWVLEIHIRHPERAIGAFYEDLLLE